MSGWTGRTRGRLIMLFWLFALMYGLLVGRLAQVQYFQNGRFAALARAQQEGDVEIPALRGEIRDRNNVVLASSLSLWSIAADPSMVKDIPAVSAKVATLLKIPVSQVEKALSGGGTFCWLGRKVPDEVANQIRAQALPGVFLLREPTPGRRYYPKGRLAAHLLGATGIDEQGLDGLEASWDDYLAGETGVVHTFMDRDGWAIPASAQRLVKKPVAGKSVVLTIDETIQYVAQRELNKSVTQYKAKGGICIVMDAKTGAILALAVAPDFPADKFASVPPALRRNRAVTDPYEPGSTFKVFLAAAAINSGVKPTDTFRAGGVLSIGGWTINNADDGCDAGYAETLADIIAYSFNVGTASVAMRIGKNALAKHLNEFGFGHTTGVDLVGEEPGILADVKDWADINTATISFGQGVAVTPLQLVSGMQAIANGGVRMRPHVVKSIVNADGSIYKDTKPEVISHPITPASSKEMLKILRGVCEKGTGKRANIPGYRVGGKTGTAQVVEGGTYAGGKYVGSFLGIAPLEDPRLVCLVKIEEPAGLYWGGLVAAPVFKNVVQEGLWKLGVRPSHPEEIVAAQRGGQNEP